MRFVRVDWTMKNHRGLWTSLTYAPICFTALVLVGCSKSHELETAEVRGIVTLDGKPVESGGILFMPPRGRAATAIIAPDGSYRMTTYHDGDGAIVGKHAISVFPRYGATEDEIVPTSARPIPQRYHNSGSSGLEADVKAGQVNVVELKLTSHR
jgi:hypothetical protein